MRLIGIRSLPLLQIFDISLKVPLGSAAFAVLFWMGQLEGMVVYGVTRQVGRARPGRGGHGYKSPFVSEHRCLKFRLATCRDDQHPSVNRGLRIEQIS